MMKFDLIFIVDTIIPSKRASAIHVEKLYEAFKHSGIKVGLISQTNNDSFHGIDANHFLVRSNYTGKGKMFVLLFKYFRRLNRFKTKFIYTRFLLFSYLINKTPFILELHADSWNKTKLHRLLFPLILKKPNLRGLVVITRAIEVDLRLEFPDFKKTITVIEDAASVPPSSYIPTFRNSTCLNIGYVGSFHKGKGVELILSIAEQMPQHNFIIVGGLVNEIQLMKKAGVTKNVHFKGFVNHDDLWKEMQDIDICLLPNQVQVFTGQKSNIGKYTSPLKMFEYMSYSKPIIASDLSVLREVLSCETALFASHNDPTEWVQAIQRIEKVEKRQELGQNAYKHFSECFTWGKRSKRILEIIES